MTDTEGAPRRGRLDFIRLFEGSLPTEERVRAMAPTRCIYKCGAACFHEAPNEARAQAGGNAFASIIERRLSRRTLLKGAAAATVPMVLAATPAGSALLGDSPLRPRTAHAVGGIPGTGLGFTPIALNQDDQVTVPEGYSTEVLLRWGDPLFPGVSRMTMANTSAALQARTFGYNCDLNAYFPLPLGSNSSSSGVMGVNHEYTEGARMFSGYTSSDPTRAQVDTELEAHGMSFVELKKSGGSWSTVLTSEYNRRVTATTPMTITGPLAGDDRLKTSADPTGRAVLGMLNNCAGGKTPWGTVLTAEENFHQYFGNNDNVVDEAQKALNSRYGTPGGESERKWERFHDRFDLAAEPHEVNRFGYVVEIDPYNPDFTPRKRTALGRFKHEAATIVLGRDNRVVAYSGDDERFEYVYKFVSRYPYRANSPRFVNMSLLDEGTLYVARFSDDGTGEWLALTPDNLPGWSIQDILLDTRAAADELGATPMDRPEDVEVNPMNSKVYLLLTNNTSRTEAQVIGSNPRGPNRFGHVIEMMESGGDMAATSFAWDIFLICGDPEDETTWYAGYDKTQVSAISAPDNVTFDGIGNVWIATDGQPGTISRNDTVFAVPSAGPDRGRVLPFLTVPNGAEVCGPEFTPDFQTLFVNVQHPGESGAGPNDPQSVWPDGTWPSLPSLVAVTKDGGGRIGS